MALNERKVEQLNNAVGEIICRLAVKGRNRLIGSNSLRSIQYGADYDAEAYPKEKTCDKVATDIKSAYLKTSKDPDVWITDFKAGWDERLVYRGDFSKASVEEYVQNPLIKPALKKKILRATGDDQEKMIGDLWKMRWDLNAMKRGYVKMIDGTRRYFKDAIMDRTPCKIDLIAKVGDRFAAISENYYITCGGTKNWNDAPDTTAIEAEFEDEIRYYTKVNKFKALKRLFSLLKLDGEDKNKAQLERLIVFFNSNVGLANKIKNELDILEELLRQPRKPKWEDVKANIQYIKEEFSQVYEMPVKDGISKFLDDITPTTALKDIAKIRDYLVDKVNAYSADFLREMLK